MRIYGYCRVSTKDQSLERQERNILAKHPDAVIFKEKFTGTRIEGRRELEKLLKTVKPDDVICFDSVSRMSRNSAEGFELYRKLFEMGVALEFLKEPQIDTETYKASMDRQITTVESGDVATDELINTITAAINRYTLRLAERQIQLAFERAQQENDDRRQNTKEGQETARRNGKHIGRTAGTKITTKKSVSAKELIRKHSKDFGGSLKDGDVIKLAGCSRNSYYKYKRELLTEELKRLED